MAWADLEAEVRSQRRIGVVTMLTIPRPRGSSGRDVADQLAVAAHYRPIGSLWLSIVHQAAAQVLQDILSYDLAYHGDVMARGEASKLAVAFLAHVGEAADFFTNGSWAEPPVVTTRVTKDPSWQPLSQATFDAGVVGVGLESAALLWVEDED